MKAAFYKKRPLEVFAMKVEDLHDAAQFISNTKHEWYWYLPDQGTQRGMKVVTLEGAMDVRVGDWLVIGVEGEVYPVKDSIFQASYEPA